MSDPHRRRRAGAQPGGNSTSLATKVVTTAVVAYGAYRLVDWAYQHWWNSGDDAQKQTNQGGTMGNNFAPELPRDTVARRRRARQQRLRRCQQECLQAWQALGSAATLSPLIIQATDTTDATNRLKDMRSFITFTDELRAEQSKLWHQVKIRSFTRFVATAYAQSLLILVLSVQINLWGAQLWNEQQEQSTSSPSLSSATNSVERMQSYQLEHQQVLQRTFAYFFANGLTDLVQCVAKATEQVLADWDVLERAYLQVSRDQVIEALGQIRSVVEELGATRRRSLWRFFVPPEDYFEDDNKNLSDISAETWDWIESPLLQDALEDTLGVTFDYCQQNCLPWEEDENATCLPLAKLLPKIKKNATLLEAQQDHALAERIQRLASVQEIGNLCFRY